MSKKKLKLGDVIKVVKFYGVDCNVQLGRYPSGRPALSLFAKKTDEYMAVATHDEPERMMSKRHICIKDWGGNEGILEVLIKARIISEPIGLLRVGMEVGKVCNLLLDVVKSKKRKRNAV